MLPVLPGSQFTWDKPKVYPGDLLDSIFGELYMSKAKPRFGRSVYLSLDEKLHFKLLELAEETSQTINGTVRRILVDHLKKPTKT